MEKQLIELKKFEDLDWDAYSGCESDNPMISDVSVTIDNMDVGPWYEKFEGCLILDGNTIFIDVGNDSKAPGDNQHYFSRVFNNEHHALTWLVRLEKDYDFTVDGSLLYSWLVDYHDFKMES